MDEEVRRLVDVINGHAVQRRQELFALRTPLMSSLAHDIRAAMDRHDLEGLSKAFYTVYGLGFGDGFTEGIATNGEMHK